MNKKCLVETKGGEEVVGKGQEWVFIEKGKQMGARAPRGRKGTGTNNHLVVISKQLIKFVNVYEHVWMLCFIFVCQLDQNVIRVYLIVRVCSMKSPSQDKELHSSKFVGLFFFTFYLTQ